MVLLNFLRALIFLGIPAFYDLVFDLKFIILLLHPFIHCGFRDTK